MAKKFGLTHFSGKMSILNSDLNLQNQNPRFSWEATETAYFVNQETKMMLGQNRPWDPNGNNGKGDSIGRTFLAFFTYGDPRFLNGIESCWERVERKGWLRRFLFGKYYYQGYRYPERYPGEIGISRDHLTYTLLAFKYAGYSDKFLKDFVKHLRFRISDFSIFTIDLWLWARVIANIKPYAIIYYPLQWLVLAMTSIWNKRMYRRSGFGEESSQEDFILIENSLKPKSMVKMASKFYPIYALHQQAWEIKLLPNSRWKKRLQKIALSLCPKHNYVIQLLLDSPNRPPEESIKSYKMMSGFRWSGILNSWLNDRDMRVIDDPKLLEYNVLDVDYLKKLYYTLPCTPIV
jgi:hypothetical protein